MLVNTTRPFEMSACFNNAMRMCRLSHHFNLHRRPKLENAIWTSFLLLGSFCFSTQFTSCCHWFIFSEIHFLHQTTFFFS